MKLVTVNEMRAIEKESDQNGVSYTKLMEHAGRGLAELVHALGQENGWDVVTAIVGAGNNGGDTLVALTWLAEAGWHTHVYLVNRKREDELVARFLSVGGVVCDAVTYEGYKTLAEFLDQSHVLLDGLLGTGIRLPLKKEAAQVLANANFILSQLDAPVFVVAVDCPSGVDCDTGIVAEETIPADFTVTMAAAKHGLLKMPAFEYIGELQVVDIGFPENLPSWRAISAEVADWEMVSALLPVRTLASHKGTFGTAFVIAGSTSYTGAALLAGTAAYRIGAGLVTMAIPEPLHTSLAGHLPEAVWIQLPHEHGFISDVAYENVLQNLGRATAVLIGPGLGDVVSTRMFVEKIIPAIKLPLVIDADGLRHLARILNWHKKLLSPAVLTPHPGEMSILTGLSIEDVQANRQTIALKYAQDWGQVVVLKGACTVIASPDGRSTIIPVATPALARAGTGDVLAGLIVGLRAQGLGAYAAAVTGAFIHAEAGLLAADLVGTPASVLARDVINAIPDVIAALEK